MHAHTHTHTHTHIHDSQLVLAPLPVRAPPERHDTPIFCSLQDVLRARKAGGSLQQHVSEAMTAPALSVPITATVQEAADLMMEQKARPLPVVDAEGLLVG